MCTSVCGVCPWPVHAHMLCMYVCVMAVCVQYIWFTYVICLSFIPCMQTRATSVPHPGWEKMVYFVCSSFALKAPTTDSKWSTQKELLAEAELEVQELKQLVQGFIRKQSPKRKPTSSKRAASGVDLSEMDLSSVCVMFPTRLTVSALYIGLGRFWWLCYVP